MDRDQLLKTVQGLFKDKPSIMVREQAFLGHGGKRVDDGSIVTPPSHIVIVVRQSMTMTIGWIGLELAKNKIPFKRTYEHQWCVFVLT